MAQQDELIKDIQKEIQQEKWLVFLKTYRVWIGMVFLAVLALVVGAGFWLYQERQTKQEASSLLLSSLYIVDKANSESQRDNTKQSADSKQNIGQNIKEILTDPDQKKWPIQTLNYTITLVHYHIQNREPEKAIAILEEIPSIDIPYFDSLIALLKGQSYLHAKEFEKAEKILKELADSRIFRNQSGSSVWGYVALEWLAELAWQNDSPELVIQHLKTLSDDPITPPAMRERATRMLRILS